MIRGGPWRPLLALAWLALLAAITLLPAPVTDSGSEPMGVLCVICGDRGTADAILNAWLFVPLGLALGGAAVRLRGRARRIGPLGALAAGLALSAAIETAQILLPGRYATLGDIVWNSLGAALGAALVRAWTARLHLHPRAGLYAAAAVAATMLSGGWLLGVASSPLDYFGQWTPDLGFMPQYGGTLLAAELNGQPVPSGRFPSARDVAGELLVDWELQARVVKGAPPGAVSPIVSIYDAAAREILVLGAHGDDLVLRERTRAKALQLDHPDLRIPAALAGWDVGDTLVLAAGRSGELRWLAAAPVPADAGRRPQEAAGAPQGDESGLAAHTHLGFTPGRTWGLLLYLEGPAEPVRRTLDTLWMLALFLPVGLLSRGHRPLLAHGAVAAAGLVASVLLTRLLWPPWWEMMGAAAGLLLGGAAGTWLAAREGRDHGTIGSPGKQA